MKTEHRYFITAAALIPTVLAAQESRGIDSGDTAWMMIATALVVLMTPAGLALFYGGLTRRKNVLNTIGMNLMAYAVGTLAWILAGYSVTFGNGDLIGSGKLLLSPVDLTDKSRPGNGNIQRYHDGSRFFRSVHAYRRRTCRCRNGADGSG